MTDETGLAAPLAASYLMDGHREDEDPDFDRMAATVLARLADPAMVEAVALVTREHSYLHVRRCRCGTDLPSVDEWRLHWAEAVLAVVRGLLGGTGGER